MRLTISVIVLALLPASWALALTTTSTSFQKDTNGYTDITEMRISQPGAAARDGTLGASVSNYLIDGWQTDDPLTPAIEADSPDEQELIRFGSIFGAGAGQIPFGATILDAQLTYKTFDTGTTPPSPGPWGVAALNQPFTTTTRYADFPSSNGNPLLPSRGAWFQDGQDQVGHPYATRPVGAFAGTPTNTLGGVADADVWSLVQRWSNDPTGANNNGFVVQAGWTGQTNGWGFFTNGTATVANRPKLSVTYTTSAIGTKTFQRDLNGYTGDTVARLSSGTDLAAGGDDITLDGSTLTGAFYIDESEATGGQTRFRDLFKFDAVFGAGEHQAPADKPVAKAWLVLTTGLSDDNRSPGPFTAHKVLRDWDLDTTTATKPSLYGEFGAVAGLQETDGDIGPALDTNPGMTNGGENWFDVTSYLEAVRTGTQDFGLAVLPQTNDGWAILMNGNTDVSVRPRLVVYSDLSTAVGLPGDFNSDGKVDAGDYATWRKNDANAALANDNGVGSQAARYALWRSSFASPPGAGSGLGGSSVPEPATWLLGLVGCVIFSSFRTRES